MAAATATPTPTHSNRIIQSRQFLYTKRPTDLVGPEHYQLETIQINLDEIDKYELILEGKFWSVDPYMRIQQSSLDTWESPHALGTVQGGGVVGQIIAVGSAVQGFAVGDWAYSYAGWREYSRLLSSQVTKLQPPSSNISPSTALGVLGMPGRTAFFGLYDIGRPRPGDTLVVSGAAGAVGILVAQLGKRAGCKVIGVAGSKSKCEMLLAAPYSLNAALNYKELATADAMKTKLKELAPNGVSIYFDNTGGHTTDAVMAHLEVRARVIICGSIADYNDGLESEVKLGPKFLHHLIYKRATIQGVLARDYAHRIDEQHRMLRPLVEAKQLILPETKVKGFDQLPIALQSLFEGKNTGKMIVEA